MGPNCLYNIIIGYFSKQYSINYISVNTILPPLLTACHFTDLTLIHLLIIGQISYFQPLTIIKKPVINNLIKYIFNHWSNIFKAVFL